MGDFGRTPQINRDAGRDHWPQCYSMVLAGGGIRGGQVIGQSDKIGAYPIARPITPADVHATVYAALAITRERSAIALSMAAQWFWPTASQFTSCCEVRGATAGSSSSGGDAKSVEYITAGQASSGTRLGGWKPPPRFALLCVLRFSAFHNRSGRVWPRFNQAAAAPR